MVIVVVVVVVVVVFIYANIKHEIQIFKKKFQFKDFVFLSIYETNVGDIDLPKRATKTIENFIFFFRVNVKD